MTAKTAAERLANRRAGAARARAAKPGRVAVPDEPAVWQPNGSQMADNPPDGIEAGMSVDQRIRYLQLKLENKFAFWRPYPRQLEFLGLRKRERLLRGGNKVGKTYTGAGEVVAHVTGRYPDWWPGRRFEQPTLIWVGGATGIAVRDAPQTLLVGLPGDPSSIGTGMIPKDLIVGTPPTSRSAPGGLDSIIVRHITGGNSKIVFKTYAQGDGNMNSWQGPYVDVIWLDEECPPDIYQEALARLTGQGCIFTTFTPLLGYSLLVNRFLRPAEEDRVAAERDRGHVQMPLSEAEHFTPEEKEQRRSGYAAHERIAREFGEPMLGEGAVFSTPEADLRLKMPLGSVPLHWRKLWGLDFGSDHPFAAVLWGFDPEDDVDYVLHCIKMRTPPNTPAILGHCDAIKRIAANVPVAWPHDGNVAREGEALKDLYRAHGLLMLPEHATHAGTGGHWTQPGVDGMDERMQQRKLLVLDSPQNEKWFEEYRAYHYKDGKIFKQFDDLMSASRIGFIMKRKAKAGPLGAAPRAAPARRAGTEFDLWTGQPFPQGAF